MANKRQLKKAIRLSCGTIAGEAITTQFMLNNNLEEWNDVVIDAALLQVAAIKRVNPEFESKPKAFANGKDYKKARRAFYKENEKQLRDFMNEEVKKIAEKMNALKAK